MPKTVVSSNFYSVNIGNLIVKPFVKIFLLIEEFGKDYGLYFSVMSCIASGINTQGAIESVLGGVTVAGHLKRLIEDYSLIILTTFTVTFLKPITERDDGQNINPCVAMHSSCFRAFNLYRRKNIYNFA